MRKKTTFLIIALLMGTFAVYANDGDSTAVQRDRKPKPKKEKSEVRTGWTFGILPSVGYDADKGFQYGLLSNVYYFGDGSVYPEYIHSLYFEAAYTTKRSGLFRFAYDSRFLRLQRLSNRV